MPLAFTLLYNSFLLTKPTESKGQASKHPVPILSGAALLESAEGNVEAAINQYFASQGAPPPTPPTTQPLSPRSHLRSIIGNNIPEEDLLALLNQAGQSVEQAANVFFSASVSAYPQQMTSLYIAQYIFMLHLLQLAYILEETG